jgi:replicative DNA helicase
MERLSREHTSLTGTPSGFRDLDEITGGFQPGNLIIIAARPSMGKSALVTNMAENASIEHGRPVALFSLEMSESELAQRFVASQARIKGDELRKGRVPDNKWPKILEASAKLAAAPLFIDDSSDVGIIEIRAKARRLHQQQPLGLIIIDYLQLMRPDGRVESRVQQVGEMSRGLKILARELHVPVVALSQLSRAVETRGQSTDSKRPLLSDLRESGSIEQDADLVAFIFREEYYDKETERAGIADIIIAKHRNGAIGDVELTFAKEYPKFLNYTSPERYG